MARPGDYLVIVGHIDAPCWIPLTLFILIRLQATHHFSQIALRRRRLELGIVFALSILLHHGEQILVLDRHLSL